MYKNFLEETILTGHIDNIYLENMPNNLLIQQNNNYVLSIQNSQFIGKLVVENIPDVLVKIFTLPLNEDSSDLIIDWGDQTYTQIISLRCKQTVKYKQKKNLIKGDCYYVETENTYYIFNGYDFSKCLQSNILPNMLIKSHQVLITSSNNQITDIKIIDMRSYLFKHIYQPGIYYFKIKGNLTGFSNTSLNNSFYKYIDIETSLPSDETQNISNIKEIPYLYLNQILAWGEETNWKTLNNTFNSAKKLKTIPSGQMPNVNEAISCFYDCIELELPKNKKILPNALIYSTSMFQNSGLSGDISYLNIPPYNTVIDKMFANTRITTKPNNFSFKNFFKQQDCFLSTLINQN